MKPMESKPFEPEVDALLEAERGAAAPPAHVQARVWDRVQASITAGAAAAPPAAAPTPGAASATLPWLKLPLLAGAVVATSALVWWQLAGDPSPTQSNEAPIQVHEAAIDSPAPELIPATPAPEAAQAVNVEPLAPAVAPKPAAKQVQAPQPTPRPRRRRVRSRKVPAVTANVPLVNPAAVHGSLGAELKLLRAARAALNRDDANAALTSVQSHRTDHPQGHLTEEREALAVQALAKLGRKKEAMNRAQRFEDRYPRSMMLPAVRAAAGHGGR